MVKTQLRPRDINDPRVLEAMLNVPRHRFIPLRYRYRGYDDCALPIEAGQTISQPYMVAIMTQLLELSGTEKVLEVGTGSGYQSAVLARLSSRVYSIERMELLHRHAELILSELGYDNIVPVLGDGSSGLSEHAPYDRILVTAGAPDIPEPLIEQLAEGGIIVIPVGSEDSQSLIQARKKNGKLSKQYHTPCIFVPLIGRHAWKEIDRFKPL